MRHCEATYMHAEESRQEQSLTSLGCGWACRSMSTSVIIVSTPPDTSTNRAAASDLTHCRTAGGSGGTRAHACAMARLLWSSAREIDFRIPTEEASLRSSCRGEAGVPGDILHRSALMARRSNAKAVLTQHDCVSAFCCDIQLPIVALLPLK